MKRVLITGANGFIGRTLTRTLEGPGWEIIPVTRVESGLRNEVTVDFMEERSLDVLRSLPAVDAVVHLAARIGWDGSSRAELFQPNVLATAELVAWAGRHNSHFVFSSAALIAGLHAVHITTDSVLGLNTGNDYLYSKWLAEEIIRMSGFSHTILRISGVFGNCGPPHLGINRAIAGVLQGVPPVQYGSGAIKRNYIYVKDLCAIIKNCIEHGVQGSHLAAGSEISSVAEMLETICDILLPGVKPEIRPLSETGGEHDQIVEPSLLLPRARAFRDAVKDIKSDTEQTTT